MTGNPDFRISPNFPWSDVRKAASVQEEDKMAAPRNHVRRIVPGSAGRSMTNRHSDENIRLV